MRIESSAVSLSAVLSFRNEEAILPELIRRLSASLTATGLTYEMIFVDDDSSDRSLVILKEQAQKNPAIKILRMKYRCGVIPCFWAGLEHASGEAMITLDADLQDPPEIFPEMVLKWQEGAQIVYAIRRKRLGESRFKQVVTKIAYRLIRWATPWDVPVDAGEFRLMSRPAVTALLQMKMPNPYFRSLVPSLGLSSVSIFYDRQPRLSGQSHFPLYSLDPCGPAATFFSALASLIRRKTGKFDAKGPHYELLSTYGFKESPEML